MLTLLVYSWLMLPLAPLNPVAQDTVAPANLHFSAGLNGPTAMLSAGPEISAKYEMLVTHPLIIRTEAEFRLNSMNSPLFPRGDLRTISFVIDAIYYRGTNILLAYIGLGAVYSFNNFQPTGSAADSLRQHHGITDVKVTNSPGYRFIFGLRVQRSYSVEVAITETRPDLQYISSHGPYSYSSRNEAQIRTGGFKVSFGYLLPVGRR